MLEQYKARLKLLLGRGVRKSYGQFGEDVIVQAMIRDTGGVYVDVGAYHPALYSNTFALYKRGWSGVVIDPNPALGTLFKSLRPRDTFVQAAIGEPTTATYHSFSDGAYNTLSDQAAEERKNLKHATYLGGTPIVCRPLRDILQEQNISEIGFMNIDVEGKDLEVLKTHNWSIPPKVIAIEAEEFNASAPQENEAYSFLHARGYELKGIAGLTLIFQKTN